MKFIKVIINYEMLSYSSLLALMTTVRDNLTGNALFTFVNNELTDFSAALTGYEKALSDANDGGKVALEKKKAAKDKLVDAARILATQVNVQGVGKKEMLLTTGFKLYNERERQVMVIPTGLTAEETEVAEEMYVYIDLPETVRDRGTVFALVLEKDAPQDKNKWPRYFTSGHSLVIKKLLLNEPYLLTAALQGDPEDEYKWCAPIRKTLRDPNE